MSTAEIKPFSEKQLLALTWWCPDSPWKNRDAVICDGAVRSGKTFCMVLSFIAWSFSEFNDSSFALCGKTIKSLRRNVVTPVLPLLKSLGFETEEKLSENILTVSYMGRKNRYYFFGGRDESSAALIQGMTLAGVFFDEVALMPRSFVEQALARCSVNSSKFWFNCNPEYPQHWFYTEWIKKLGKKNALYLHFVMEDNPSLSPKTIARYKRLYSGAFYERFILGKWVAVFGAVYPFMEDESCYCEPPRPPMEDYAVSCDYGTVNPASFGLWGLKEGVWYRLEEYYYESRKTGVQRTDEEHYEALKGLAGDKKISVVVVDPSAASFIQVIQRHGEFLVVPAKNNVTDGIRKTSTALKEGKIKICNTCRDSMREFSLYRWESSGKFDAPVKENDHAMDDIRYFVTTVLENNTGFAACAVAR